MRLCGLGRNSQERVSVVAKGLGAPWKEISRFKIGLFEATAMNLEALLF